MKVQLTFPRAIVGSGPVLDGLAIAPLGGVRALDRRVGGTAAELIRSMFGARSERCVLIALDEWSVSGAVGGRRCEGADREDQKGE